MSAQATWRNVMDSPVTLSVFGQNLGDKEYVAAGTSSHSGSGYTVVFPGAPRTYGIELSYEF